MATSPELEALLGRAAARGLRADIAGEVVLPGEATYDRARTVFNTMYDRRPAVVVRAANEDDVTKCVAFAAEHALPLAVRCGGHSLAGHSTAAGGLVLDLAALRSFSLSPDGVATCGGGISAGAFSAGAHERGLAVSFGDSPGVGVAGLTLAGGIGYLARRDGMAIDRLISVDMVLADGRRVTASEEEEPDLFWAVRGGGGNFGVVTRLRYRARPLGAIQGGWLVLPATPESIHRSVELATAAPDELTIVLNVFRMPSLGFVPEVAHGRLVAAITAVWAGDPAAGARTMARFRGIARPLADLVGTMPYPEVFRFSRNAHLGPHGTAARTTLLRRLDDAVVDAALEFPGRAPSPFAAVQLRVLGGAMSRIAPGATAFAHRDVPLMLNAFTEFEAGEDASPHRAWADAFWRAVRPYGSGAYVGLLQDESEDAVRAAYPAPTYARLAAVKWAYDPDNLFRMNHNVRPGG